MAGAPFGYGRKKAACIVMANMRENHLPVKALASSLAHGAEN